MSSPSRAAVAVALLLAVAAGALMAVQAKVNGELGRQLGDAFTAAAWSFGSGLLILAVAVALSRRLRAALGRVRDAVRAGRLPWWMLCGGAVGALLVLSQTLTTALLGVATFTIGIIAGQAAGGLAVDRIGLAPTGVRHLSPLRVSCAVVSVAAVLWALSFHMLPGIPPLFLVLPLLAGVLISVQQAMNGRVAVAGSVGVATFVNFTAGTSVLLPVAAVHLALAGPPESLPQNPWLFVGGPIGILFILALNQAVKVIGVLLLGLGTVAGQVGASVLLDLASADVAGPVWPSLVASAVVLACSVLLALGAGGRRMPGAGVRP